MIWQERYVQWNMVSVHVTWTRQRWSVKVERWSVKWTIQRVRHVGELWRSSGTSSKETNQSNVSHWNRASSINEHPRCLWFFLWNFYSWKPTQSDGYILWTWCSPIDPTVDTVDWQILYQWSKREISIGFRTTPARRTSGIDTLMVYWCARDVGSMVNSRLRPANMFPASWTIRGSRRWQHCCVFFTFDHFDLDGMDRIWKQSELVRHYCFTRISSSEKDTVSEVSRGLTQPRTQ